jgi:hypothetical protein
LPPRSLAALRRAPIVAQRLLSVDDVAKMLGRSPEAVRALLKTGKLKNASPDGRVQVDIKDIEVWLANNKRD